MSEAKNGDWLTAFPALGRLDGEALATLRAAAMEVALPAGVKAFEIGSPCETYLLIKQGSVRVQQIAESGREIVLYRVGSGQTCVLTTTNLLAHADYLAEGVTESPVEAVAVPRACFERLLASSEAFRDFVFSTYGERITSLLLLVEEVAFGRVDARLAQRLLDRRGAEGQVALTHQQLAVELGTAREVVSRQLKDFEQRGWLRLERGRIAVLAPAALEALASHSER